MGKGTVSARDLLGGEPDPFEFMDVVLRIIDEYTSQLSGKKNKRGCYCSMCDEKG